MRNIKVPISTIIAQLQEAGNRRGTFLLAVYLNSRLLRLHVCVLFYAISIGSH